MGVLKPDLGNANYSSAGQLSPLLNDPYYKTIGIGTKIFLGGGTGFVAWQGTQHNPDALRTENGVPKRSAGTLCVIGDLKQMEAKWLVGTSMMGYGHTLTVGIGVPVPILSQELRKHLLPKTNFFRSASQTAQRQTPIYPPFYPRIFRGPVRDSYMRPYPESTPALSSPDSM